MIKRIVAGLVIVLILSLAFYFTRAIKLTELINSHSGPYSSVGMVKYIDASNTEMIYVDKDLEQLSSVLSEIHLYKNWTHDNDGFVSSTLEGETFKVTLLNEDKIELVIYINNRKSISFNGRIYYIKDKNVGILDEFFESVGE